MLDKSVTNLPGQLLVERINLLRGIAIAGVLAVHTSGHFTDVHDIRPVVSAGVVVDAFAHYAVPLFILLSGLTLTRRYGVGRLDSGRFYGRRLTRVVPPYVLFSLLYLLLFALDYKQPPAPAWILLALATGNAYYHLWFVAMLVQFYLLYPLFLMMLRRARSHGRLLLAVALLLQLAWNLGAPLIASILPERPLFETLFSNRVFLSHLFYFTLGMAAGLNVERFENRVRSLPPGLLVPAVMIGVGVTSADWLWGILRYGSLGATPAAVLIPAVAVEPLLYLATVALIWQLMPWLQGAPRPLRNGLAWLGIVSFPIYLVHVFFQWLLARVLDPLGLTPATWGFYPIVFFATLILSGAAAWAFVRLPYGDYLTGAPRPRVEP